ncbi:hypothetical protein MMC14_006431, partial [Varicellaria rhodocarpa]|nr:hypothetical protein [Varicellaria rhodocarpa]
AIEAGAQADTVLDGFFEACVANPDEYYLKYNPFVIGSDPSTGLVNYNAVKGLIFGSLYNPTTEWQPLAGALHALLNSNTTLSIESLTAFGEGGVGSADPFSPAAPDAVYGIQCADTSLRSNNVTSLIPIIDATIAASKIAGESFAYLEPISCAPWRFFAKERYSGNFQTQTKNPIMFVGGPFNPVTPLVSARNMSEGFEGSVVLQHNGYGHTSLG